MTAPTSSGPGDDDLAWREGLNLTDGGDETYAFPTSGGRRATSSPNPFRDVPPQEIDEDIAPLRVDVSIAVVGGAWLGATAQGFADRYPGTGWVMFLGCLSFLLLLIRWTRKR